MIATMMMNPPQINYTQLIRKKLFINIDIFLNQTPLYFGFSITGLILTIFIGYLALLAFLGRKPYVPYVSDIVISNFGG